MLRVNLTRFSFCDDQSTGYPFLFFMKVCDFSSPGVMNLCVKYGHFDVSWHGCALFVYKGYVAGHFDPNTLM